MDAFLLDEIPEPDDFELAEIEREEWDDFPYDEFDEEWYREYDDI